MRPMALAIFVIIQVLNASASTADSPCSLASLRLLEQRAIEGDVEAEVFLAKKLLSGDCGHENRDYGLDLMISAAQKNHVDAQFELGRLMYAEARTDPEEHEARELIETAAHAGLADAQELYGVIIMHSSENAAQRDEGLYWLGSAASNGSSRAAIIAYTIFKNGVHGVQPDLCLAAMWAEAAHAMSGASVPQPITVDQECR